MSQGDVANLVGWSLSKMQRIESGEVGVSSTDLRALLDVYGVTDPGRVERLAEDARISRRQRYVTAPEHREHLTPNLRELMQFEKEAVSIRAYQPVTFPGVVQTPAVAEAVVGRWTSDVEARRVRYEARMSRRKQVIERADGPEYFLVLDEAVIKRRFGGVKATAEQLEDIADLARQNRLHIRVVPFAKGTGMVAMGPFQIVNLDHEENSVCYTESFKSDEILHDPEEVQSYREAFESLWEMSLSEAATLRLIVAEAAILRASQDQDADN
jgi:transcriptional regulator with XRE-family HTH domain